MITTIFEYITNFAWFCKNLFKLKKNVYFFALRLLNIIEMYRYVMYYHGSI